MSSTVKIEVAVKIEASEEDSSSQSNAINHGRKDAVVAPVVHNAGVRKRRNNRITHPPEYWQALFERLENMPEPTPEERVARERAALKSNIEAKAIVFLQRTPPSPRGARCHASVCVCGQVAGHQQIFSSFRISIESWPHLDLVGRYHVECFENIMPIPKLIPETFCLDTRFTSLSCENTIVQGPSILFAWVARKGAITIDEYAKHRMVYDDAFEIWSRLRGFGMTDKDYECPPKPADPEETPTNGTPESCLLSEVLTFIANDNRGQGLEQEVE